MSRPTKSEPLKLSTLNVLIEQLIKEHGDIELRDSIGHHIKGLEVYTYNELDDDDWDFKLGDKYVHFTHFSYKDFE